MSTFDARKILDDWDIKHFGRIPHMSGTREYLYREDLIHMIEEAHCASLIHKIEVPAPKEGDSGVVKYHRDVGTTLDQSLLQSILESLNRIGEKLGP